MNQISPFIILVVAAAVIITVNAYSTMHPVSEDVDGGGAHFSPLDMPLDRLRRSAPAPHLGRRDSSGPSGKQDRHGFNTPIRGQKSNRGQSRG